MTVTVTCLVVALLGVPSDDLIEAGWRILIRLRAWSNVELSQTAGQRLNMDGHQLIRVRLPCFQGWFHRT
jgi:hypothetical protein